MRMKSGQPEIVQTELCQRVEITFCMCGERWFVVYQESYKELYNQHVTLLRFVLLHIGFFCAVESLAGKLILKLPSSCI